MIRAVFATTPLLEAVTRAPVENPDSVSKMKVWIEEGDDPDAVCKEVMEGVIQAHLLNAAGQFKSHMYTDWPVVICSEEAQPDLWQGIKPILCMNAIRHANEHVNKWEAQAAPLKKPEIAEKIQTYRNFFEDSEKLLVSAAEAMQKQRETAAAQPVAAPAQPQGAPMVPDNIKITETIPYDKAPPQIQRQLEAMLGLKPAYGAGPQNDWGGPMGGAPSEATQEEQPTGLAEPKEEAAEPA